MEGIDLEMPLNKGRLVLQEDPECLVPVAVMGRP